MADMDLEHSGLQEVANAMREENENHHTQKRKRDSESADDMRRGNKRVSPNLGNKVDLHHHADGVESLQDYNALHHHQHHDHNGSAEHASSTAAAALAGLYPTMTIPQPTDVSFATQGSDDRNQDNSFMDNSQQGGDSFMESSTPSGRGSGSKPAVGSDEWHKVRKDNHKEGE